MLEMQIEAGVYIQNDLEFIPYLCWCMQLFLEKKRGVETDILSLSVPSPVRIFPTTVKNNHQGQCEG